MRRLPGTDRPYATGQENLNADAINFTLLRAPGDIVTDATIDPETIESALDIYRDLMGI